MSLIRRGNSSGFTLIELLIVIGVIIILFVSVITIIDPSEKLAQFRDSERKKNITTLGTAAYHYRLQKGSWPPYQTAGVNVWMQRLVDEGELKGLIPEIQNLNRCWPDATAYDFNNYCVQFYTNPVRGIIWTRLESRTERKICGGGSGIYVFDTNLMRTCIKCPSIIIQEPAVINAPQMVYFNLRFKI